MNGFDLYIENKGLKGAFGCGTMTSSLPRSILTGLLYLLSCPAPVNDIFQNS